MTSTIERMNDPRNQPCPFLKNGGEAGKLLRAIDWSSHPLGQPETWPNALQTTVGIILRSRQPMFVCWGPEHHTIYNDAYAQICGRKHPAALGARFRDIWTEIWDDLDGLVARVYTGEPIHMDDIQLLMLRKGYPEETHFSFSYNPLDDVDGTIAGFLCVCTETTHQVMLQRELDHERNQLGQIFAQSPSFIAKLHGPDHVFEIANPAYMKLVGYRDIIGKPVAEALPDIVEQGYIEMLDSVLQTGKAVRLFGAKVTLAQYDDSPAGDRFVDFVYQPVVDRAQNVTGIFVNGVDVTERMVATADLRNSEQFLRSVLSATPDCIMVLNPQGRIIYWSDGGHVSIDAATDAHAPDYLWLDLWDEDGRIEAAKALELAQTGADSGFQGIRRTIEGNQRYWDVRVSPMEDADGNPERILVVSRDISYLKRVEDERDLLTNELSHRLKNSFAMVQSVVRQTLRNATSVDKARNTLIDRVRALEAAQDILTRSSMNAMPITEVLDSALAPHAGEENRFRISGPPAFIEGRKGLGLSLALHELCTNAVKYGALSHPDGTVHIEWQVAADGTFSFVWREIGGPAVTPPSHSGFGSAMIKDVVAAYFEGSATLDFHPTGVVFQLDGSIATPDSL